MTLKWLKENLNACAIFLLTLGCVSTIGKLTVCAAVFFIIDCFLNRKLYSIKDLFDEKIISNSWKVIILSIGLFAIASILNESIEGVKEAKRYLERSIHFFLIIILIYRRKNILMPLMLGTCGGILTVVATAMYSYIFEKIMRPSGILDNPNELGGWAILVLPLIVACTYYYRDKTFMKVLGGTVSALVVLTLVLSGSRGAMLGLAVMVVLGNMIYFRLKVKHILTIILLFSVFTIGAYQLDISGLQRSYDNERILARNSAIEMFLDYPLVGVGWDNWNSVYRAAYISPMAKEPYLWTPHNIILHYLDTVGIVGTSGILILFISQIYCLTKILYKNNKVNVVAFCMLLCIVGMLVHGMVDVIFKNRFFMILYSFLWGITCYSVINGNKPLDKV